MVNSGREEVGWGRKEQLTGVEGREEGSIVYTYSENDRSEKKEKNEATDS